MKAHHFFLNFLYTCGRVMPGFVFLLLTREAEANPTGLTVVSGSASAQTSGSQLNVTASQNAVLNWTSFNIAANEKTIFTQPSATSVVFNRITDQNPSLIYGSLQANGIVVLLNSSGFYFGPNSFVSAAGLVVSSSNFAPPQNGGGAWQFNGPPPLASIVNYGQVKIGNGGDCFFIADKIENHGKVEADGGNIAFAAGQTVTLSERPDGRGMSMQVTLPQGSVDNYGNVIADGGTIALNAKVVNQNGFIQANSVRDEHGVIELLASDSLNLGADSKISAQGDDSVAVSDGGKVTLKSDNIFSDAAGSQIVTKGGANGGNGGNMEVSAPNIQSLSSSMDASARTGFTGGEFLLDPASIELGSSGSGTVPNNGTVAYNSGSGTLNLNVGANGAFANKNFANILLQATGDITMDANTVWDLSGSTGGNSGLVTLQAGGNILLNNGAKILDAHSWSLAMQAGYDFTKNLVTPAKSGSITLAGTSAIQLAAGAVNLTAAQNITVNAGYIITTGGGGINAHALAGNIDTGSDAQGYLFVPNAATIGTAYNLNDGLGGISTKAGGDVDLTAGGNVTSVLPDANGSARTRGYFYDGTFKSGTGDYATAGAGAYGPQAGNVNIVAGGNVTGHYLVANGTGSIYAGVQMDANGNPVSVAGKYALGASGNAGNNLLGNSLALSLIKGGWNVSAAQNINLQEVRNPNGLYNISGSSAMKHYFDYAPSDFVDLAAGNQVRLGGTAASLLRVDTLTIPTLYPGILNIIAGAGGVVLTGDSTYKQLVLFPSPLGGLVIDTTGGGLLTGQLPSSGGQPQIFNLIVSDSGPGPQYVNSSSFGLNDHAATPVHADNEGLVELNISGDMDLVALDSSEAAQINVVGDLNNSRFQGMNQKVGDTSSITVGQMAKDNMEKSGVLNPATDSGLVVGGNIANTGAFTTIDLSTISGSVAPDLSVLARSLSSQLSVATLETSVYYDSKTHKLTYQTIPNVSVSTVVSLLQNLTVQQVDAHGNLLWQDPQQTVPLTATVAVIDPATASALTKAYTPPPTDQTGYTIVGGGAFKISANNIDLGTTAGIISSGAGTVAMSGGTPIVKGADITVDAYADPHKSVPGGDLTMFSSSIASFNGGDLYVNADGNLDVGSPDFTVTTSGARGIFSTGLGNVAVYAGKNIDVEGSRIAAYDTRPLLTGIPAAGGSLTVVSRGGNVIIGAGGSGFVTVNYYNIDPLSLAVTPQSITIPGTGLLSTSFNRSGNVLVEALTGDVTVGVGGIKQVLFKGGQTAVNNDVVAALLRLGLERNYAGAVAYEKLINGNIAGVPLSTVEINAGYGSEILDAGKNPVLDPFGNPLISAVNLGAGTVQEFAPGKNVNAEGSGIITAGNLVLNSANATGNFISTGGNVDIKVQQNFSGNVFAAGIASVNTEGGTISGDVIGVEGVSASGGTVDANLESNGTIAGDTSGQAGFSASTTAANVAAAAGNEETTKTAKTADDNSDDELNKKKKGIALAQKVSRVTVILPRKN